ncbi:ABC transporter substrate-binding protein [Aeromicrobium choanae]|uniref:Peptide/nickel transport system substrate-binding protein n=1 Tax=Aeromicrobium choanae TaxID=1736691 RepID=A0A1T4Z3K3_9ACTN|nr:ABC transporter substrate-binding protein [Aeromicrobium choanae]SKB08443.1 peptide/nickel transport system substrate-binding protein [Aeromicrobium choanae]
MKILTKAVSASVIATLALSGCGGGGGGQGGPSESSDHAPDEVITAARYAVDTFDPHKSTLGPSASQLFDGIYDTLVRRSEGKIVGSLASEWEVTPNSVTFTLKDDLTCGDGTPLTASAIAESTKRFADPETGAQMTSMSFGPSGVKEIVGDDEANTVTVTVKDPYGGLLDGMTNAYVVCPGGLKDPKKLATDPAAGESGSYTLESSEVGHSYTMVRRDDTVVTDPKTLVKEFTVKVVESDTTRANMLTSGELNVAAIAGADVKRLSAEYEPIIGAASLVQGLVFNHREGFPTADQKLREAISYIIDSESYTKAATFGTGKAYDTLFTDNTDCYFPENEQYSTGYDEAKAKELLAEAGYGPDGKELELRALGLLSAGSGPKYIVDQLQKLGVKTSLRQGSQDQIVGILFGEGDWDIMVFPYDQSGTNPFGIVNGVSNVFGGSLNVGDIENAEFDALVPQAAQQSGDEACATWEKAEQALLKATDIKPLMQTRSNWFTPDRLSFEAGFLEIDTRSVRAPK